MPDRFEVAARPRLAQNELDVQLCCDAHPLVPPRHVRSSGSPPRRDMDPASSRAPGGANLIGIPELSIDRRGEAFRSPPRRRLWITPPWRTLVVRHAPLPPRMANLFAERMW